MESGGEIEGESKHIDDWRETEMTDARRRRKNAYSKGLRDWYREHGICNRCGRVWADAGYVTCKACREKNKQSLDKTDPGRERWKANRTKLRHERIENGLCPDCGAEAVKGRKHCMRCLEARRDSSTKYRILKRMDREAEQARVRSRENRAG